MLCDFNKAADALTKMGSTQAGIPLGVFVQDLIKPSIKLQPEGEEESATAANGSPGEALLIYEGSDWRKDIGVYLNNGSLPLEDKDNPKQGWGLMLR